MKVGGAQSFGELAEKHYQYITSPFQQPGCNRVDVLFDRYDKPYSIKGNECERRGSSSALEIKIIGPSTPVPKQWNKYISNPQNKRNLTTFLPHTWCHISQQELHHGQVLVLGGGFKEYNKAVLVVKGLIRPFRALQSDHEEADTRMILHAHDASQDHDRVVIQSPDTDVAVLATHFLLHTSSIHWPANSYGFELGLRTSYVLFPFIVWWKILAQIPVLLFYVFMPLRDVIQQVVFMELERKKPG